MMSMIWTKSHSNQAMSRARHKTTHFLSYFHKIMEIKQKHYLLAIPAVVLVGMVVIGASMPSGMSKDISALRYAMAETDLQLKELKDKYQHHAGIVEANQKILVDLSSEADRLRKINEETQAKITSLIEGKE